MNQPDLIRRFDGPAYQPELDFERLNNQHERIKALMLVVHAPESSVSAQLRHLRKPRFGGYTVERQRVDGGLYAYRMVV